eukprot:TRINITY_DN21939_c0_g1_i1.p1 TRINITY_DN21939_c0_g1~~TRINITY_DN21939_c0_g1_i1.p1  ORF type:complete len:164 (+),score=19.24 TRINITY_DN21939_c0_g1_i1:183-674(+)
MEHELAQLRSDQERLSQELSGLEAGVPTDDKLVRTKEMVTSKLAVAEDQRTRARTELAFMRHANTPRHLFLPGPPLPQNTQLDCASGSPAENPGAVTPAESCTPTGRLPMVGEKDKEGKRGEVPRLVGKKAGGSGKKQKKQAHLSDWNMFLSDASGSQASGQR